MEFFFFFFREIQLTFKFFFAECWNFQNAIAFSNNLYFTQFFTIKVQNSKVLVQKCFQNYKNQPKKSPQQQQMLQVKAVLRVGRSSNWETVQECGNSTLHELFEDHLSGFSFMELTFQDFQPFSSKWTFSSGWGESTVYNLIYFCSFEIYILEKRL